LTKVVHCFDSVTSPVMGRIVCCLAFLSLDVLKRRERTARTMTTKSSVTLYSPVAGSTAASVPTKNRILLSLLSLIDFDLLVWSAAQRLFMALSALASMFKTSAQLRLENLALRQQLGVLRRSAPKRLKLTLADRIFWVSLRGLWHDWKSALLIVKPDTVVAWHRKGFRLFWRWKIRHGKPGRPTVRKDVRDLIRMISRNNPRWGAPRICHAALKDENGASALSISSLFSMPFCWYVKRRIS
jgi:hypothetical protein